MLQVASECFRMHQKPSECIRMLENASECIRMLQNASECFRLLQNASECIRRLQNASECFRMLQNASRMLQNARKRLDTSQIDSKFSTVWGLSLGSYIYIYIFSRVTRAQAHTAPGEACGLPCILCPGGCV